MRHKVRGRKLSFSVQLFQLFGSVPAQIGWLFLLFSSFVFWPLIAQPLYENILLSGSLEKAPGVVVKYESTGLEMEGEAVIAHQVRYQVQGKEYKTYAYLNGAPKEPLTEVSVAYPKQHPELALVKGLRRLAIPNSSLYLFLSLPLIAAVLAGTRLYRGYRDVAVLRSGKVVWANKQDADSEELEKHVWVYQHEGKDYSLPAPDTQDEKTEILYLPVNPERALRLNRLPGTLTLKGDIVSCSYSAFSVLVLILPLWVSVINIWFLTRLFNT